MRLRPLMFMTSYKSPARDPYTSDYRHLKQEHEL